MTTPSIESSLLPALIGLLRLFEEIDGGEHDDEPEFVAARAAITAAGQAGTVGTPDMLTALKLTDRLNVALTSAGAFDRLCADIHPDEINATCDAVRSAIAAAEPASPEARAKVAVAHLRRARDLLRAAGATRAVDRVRSAITSAGGAVRHASGKAVR